MVVLHYLREEKGICAQVDLVEGEKLLSLLGIWTERREECEGGV